MLDSVDLKKSISKTNFKESAKQWESKFGTLQRSLKDRKVPTIVLLEGWETAGKGTVLSQILLNLDPRGYWVHNIVKPTREEKLRPFLWRYWIRLPGYGEIAFFNHSWYWELIEKALKEKWNLQKIKNELEEIKTFERHLVDDGVLLIKIFLHISKAEQQRRFKKLEEDPSTEWRTKGKYKNLLKSYEKIFEITNFVLTETNLQYSKWNVIPSTDLKYSTAETARIILNKWEETLSENRQIEPYILAPRTSNPLSTVDLNKELSQQDYEKILPKLQKKLRELHYLCYKKRIPVVIIFEGWDAGGKGGVIKRLVRNLDPRGYDVVPISAPQGEEKNHHHLWRFWKALPKAGHFTIYDRSWYGRVLVERVESFATEEQWKRAYSEINEFEMQLAKWGAIIMKFWMHISPDEQLKRFQERQSNPLKQWKITEEDWRNRAKWNDYEEAVNDMIDRTSTVYAPWHIIEGNSKLYARVKVLNIVVDTIKKHTS
ncbi:MAG: polyphosphate:AMP phosphotransferase [Candidatus Hydrogenedentes bacterium]|nr:polyphosphate:AMP phosphotransferase [Candidatus Hydrogenedentota bacterium]